MIRKHMNKYIQIRLRYIRCGSLGPWAPGPWARVQRANRPKGPIGPWPRAHRPKGPPGIPRGDPPGIPRDPPWDPKGPPKITIFQKSIFQENFSKVAPMGVLQNLSIR